MTRDEVLEALRAVIDPEAGIDIVDLGLVERLEIAPGAVRLALIMTSPSCPQGVHLAAQAREAIEGRAAPALSVTVDVLDRPHWSPERMSDEARRRMGWR